MLQKIKQHKYLKYLINPYILVLIGFVIWMLFIDDNSYLFHRELDAVIDEKKSEIKLYQTEIDKDKKSIKKLENSDQLENFAREEYYMKKENEEIYIIEYENDSTKKKKDE
ncbi:FtsB family cell division protein [Pseudofulvibacter geojedonensis]|uniref:Septum formation initiator family protein n=1 Tax=Pseudofulvibacter geojedonensis TaxID=1123758 RepID=A0ABW3I3D8_9FLAO